MANTFEDYTAISNQLDPSNAAYGFVFNFPYLEDTHVTVEVDGTLLSASNYTIQTSPDKRVLISSGVNVGQKVRVRRNSNADSDNPYVDFVNGSVLNETDQDNAYRHNLYLNEELAALNQQSLQKEVGGTNWDAQNLKIINLPTPTLASEATSKTYVDSKVATAINGSPQTPVKYAFTGDGSNAAFTFSPGIALDADEMYEVAIDGVLQEPTTAYAIDANANTITFTSVPPNASKIVVINRGYLTPVVGATGPAGPAGSITNGSVTTDKLANGAVTSDKTSFTNLEVTDVLTVASNGGNNNFGGIEVGGTSGGYIDFKNPIGDDYDGRVSIVGAEVPISIIGKYGVDFYAGTTPVAVATLNTSGDLNITGNYKVNGTNLTTTVPTGTVSAFAGLSAPTGYALCDGSQYSRTTEAALFAVIGTAYNTGGETANHFRVPDLRGRVIAGQDDMGGVSANRLTVPASGLNGDNLGATGGAETHLLTAAESGLPSHNHTIPIQFSSGGNTPRDGGTGTDTQTKTTGNTGGNNASSAHNNVQPTMILNYIIKI